jgi:uncharacterized protein (TIGR04255 family)
VFELEPVNRYRLQRPPLAQALVEIRYPARAWLETADGIVDLQRRLLDVFPYMDQEQSQQVTLVVGANVAAPAGAAQPQRLWRFTDDAGWTLRVGASSTVLSVGADYADFGEFRTRLVTVLSALHESAALPRCDRLGLRYVDVAEVPPGDETIWRDWFRPELTGWSAGDLVGENTRLLTTLTQTHLAAPPLIEGGEPPLDVQALIRHGYVPPQSVIPGVPHGPIATPAFLLDLDLFVEGHQPFDAEPLAEQVTALHDQIDRFFRWALTPAGERHFGLEELE